MLKTISGAMLLVAALTLTACHKSEASPSGPSARALVEQHGALLLDVRTPAEYGERHLPGAVNVPLQELDRRMSELGPKDRPIVLYCRSGNRSAKAARLLTEAGYTSVRDIGTMSAY